MASLRYRIKQLYEEYGQRKKMGIPANLKDRPHFFLHRTFLADHDLLIIFNTKRCRNHCNFCGLPTKCSQDWIPDDKIIAQFEYVIKELKHSLSVLNRITLSNEGSMLDTETFPKDALLTIIDAICEIRMVRRIVLETRVEFCDLGYLQSIKELAPKALINILAGFETVDNHIREVILGKRQSIDVFLNGLDNIAAAKSETTCFILFKPDQSMTDQEASDEAWRSFLFLRNECEKRKVILHIRLNPMYRAAGSRWDILASHCPEYQPPRLTDVMKMAQRIRATGTNVYIGLSSEGVENPAGTFFVREDYSPKLIGPIKLFNDKKIDHFDGL